MKNLIRADGIAVRKYPNIVEDCLYCSSLVSMGLVFLFFLFIGYKLVTFGYPFGYSDDWTLYGASLITNGSPLYLDPSLQHPVIGVYPPLYFAIFAPIVWLFGFNHSIAQLLVLIASLGSGVFIYLILRRQKLSAGYSLLFALFFFSTNFTLSGQMILLILPGAFILLILLAVLYLIFRWESDQKNWQLMLIFSLLWVGCFIKQTVVVYGASVFIYFLIQKHYKTAVSFLVSSLIVVGGVFVAGNYLSKGMWYAYLITIPKMAPFQLFKWPIIAKLLLRGGFVFGALGFVIFKLFYKSKRQIPPEIFFLLVILPYSIMAVLHYGGTGNQFLEFSALLALLLGRFTADSTSLEHPQGSNIRIAMFLGITLYALVNFVLMPIYLPIRYYTPNTISKNSGKELTELVRRISPKVALAHCYTSFIFKNSNAVFVNTGLSSNFYFNKAYDTNIIAKNVAEGYYDLIILVHEVPFPFISNNLNKQYRLYKSYDYVLYNHLDVYCKRDFKKK